MSDQSPYSQYNPQNPYSGDPQWPNQQQEGYPPANEPYQSSIPPTQYAQPYPSSPSPYPSQPNQPGMYGAPNPYAPQAPYPGVGVPYSQPQGGNGQAIAGLVLGIISLFICWIPFFGLPLPIVGIILSALGRRSPTGRTIGTVGLVLSIIALAVAIIFIVIIIIAAIAGSQRSTP
jgi:hypothetical protein